MVAQELERWWNAAFEEVRAIESRIIAESEGEQTTSVGTLDDFKDLAGDLEALWNHPQADERTKKRLLRALIREIVVDIDEQTSEVVLLLHRKGGVHNAAASAAPWTGESRGHIPKDIGEAVRVVVAHLQRRDDYRRSATHCSRQLLDTSVITSLRANHQIGCHDASEMGHHAVWN